jgi:hypothetical protein
MASLHVVTRSLRSALRRACGLLLAIGLVPAASGGAVCLSHWNGDAGRTAAPEASAHTAHAAHAPSAHDHHAPSAHEYHAPDTTSDAPTSGAPASDAPAHDAAAPCTALAACGVAAAPEPTRQLAVPSLPHSNVRITEHALPRGPAHAPDVPPPRR